VIVLTGLGPGDLDRIPGTVRSLLLDPERELIIRTRNHPAAKQLADLREVSFCDDFYDTLETFEDVYTAIAERVIAAGDRGDVIYAVPGSPLMGEFAVGRILQSGAETEVIPAESFVDAILKHVGYDAFDRGLQILNGHSLPDPLVLDKPTIVGHLDRPEILIDVAASLGRVMKEDATLTVFSGLGASDERVVESSPHDVDRSLAGFRTSIYLDVEPGGLVGAIHTMRILREQCPWDRDQTHASLVKYLVEESNELIDAVSRLQDDEIDWVAYSAVEDELGDVLLNVLFHAVIARQAGVFDIDDVSEVLRQKLVRRHPHVFGDLEVGSAEEVKANWDLIKADEKGVHPKSAMDGIPSGMPGFHRASKVQNRAAKVGFDWDKAEEVLPMVGGELEELEAVLGDKSRSEDELGDVLFSIVNLARHLGLEPEIALRRATDRFESRFRRMEEAGPLKDLGMSEMDELWEAAKGAEDPETS
jgi:tetrapyrrole methylase family protein/MazG family protein